MLDLHRFKNFIMSQKVVDTHIHLAVDWKEGGAGLRNGWLPSEPASFQREWAEVSLDLHFLLFCPVRGRISDSETDSYYAPCRGGHAPV